MKQIIIKIATLITITFLCDRVIGFVFEKYIFQKTLSLGSVNYLLKKEANIDFMIAGTSRAVFQIDPALITAVDGIGYNAGASGSGNMQYVSSLLDIIINKKIVPKTLLLQLDAGGFVKKTTNKELIQLYPFYDKSLQLQQYASALGFQERMKLLFRMYRYNGQVPGIVANFLRTQPTPDGNGFIPNPKIFDTTKETVVPFPSNVFENFNEDRLGALINIFEQCRVNQIKLFLIFPPTYNNGVYRQQNHFRLIQYIRSKTSEPIIDMADIRKFKDLQSSINWLDANHLNSIGAAKFSHYLNDSLMQYRDSTMKLHPKNQRQF
jgi:hypothetical protein